ncbi:MAG: hypothetical protein A2017_06890 [Lentisphaerae bacterium GWF2_44_16]|nr:MAG: hypothetical protein A2017_06890 [Lentisphaerae bacterium GWF2_44_16]
MSYNSGWKALNMEFTDKVPRTEYSAHNHWELVKEVTGIDTSKEENRKNASSEFLRKWDYAFMWSTSGAGQYLKMRGGRTTDMGHAEYAELANGRSDFRDTVQAPFKDPEDVWALDVWKEYGEFDKKTLVKDFEDTYKRISTTYPNTLNMTGIYTTMVSGLLNILGWDMFLLSLGTDEKKFAKLMDMYCEWIKQFYDACAETSIPVFMCHDDMVWTSGPFASPDWYRKNLFPKYKKLLAPLKEAGKKIIFTSDGTYTMFFDDIVDCGADMLVMEPSSDMTLFAEKYGKTHGFVGNADCRILLDGSKEDIYKEVERCMNTGKKYPGFIMAVGNHIPQNTPVDNALYYNEAYEKLSAR